MFAIDKPVDPLRTKLIILTSTLIVLLFTGTCAFQYSEVTFGTSNYTILESLYVVMVTLSTVGYGGKFINSAENASLFTSRHSLFGRHYTKYAS